MCYLNVKNNMSCDFFVFLVHEDISLNMNFNKFDFVFWMLQISFLGLGWTPPKIGKWRNVCYIV